MSNTISFDSIPQVLSEVLKNTNTIIDMLSSKVTDKSEISKILDLENTLSYLREKGYKISKSTLYKNTADNTIPHIKLGNKLCFDTLELDEWIKKKTLQSNKEVNNSNNTSVNFYR